MEIREAHPENLGGVKKKSLASMEKTQESTETGQEQAAHAHADSDKVYYVIEGVGRFRIDDDEREVGTGNAVFAPAGSRHAVVNPGPERLAVLVFMAPKPA